MPQPLPANKEMALRTMQIIAAVLLTGVVLFGAVAAFIALGRQTPEDGNPLVAYIAAGMSLLVLVAWAIVPEDLGQPRGLMDSASRATSRAASPATDALSSELACYVAYQTRMIIRYALLESAAFANLVAVLIDGQTWSLVLAGALALLMVAIFPTRGRVERYVRERLELM